MCGRPFSCYPTGMNFFETPNDRDAYVLGISVEELEAQQDAVTADEESLAAANNPDLDPEDRYAVDEAHVQAVSAQDREDLQTVLDWEEYHI